MAANEAFFFFLGASNCVLGAESVDGADLVEVTLAFAPQLIQKAAS
jgi:hypothetical protein